MATVLLSKATNTFCGISWACNRTP